MCHPAFHCIIVPVRITYHVLTLLQKLEDAINAVNQVARTTSHEVVDRTVHTAFC